MKKKKGISLIVLIITIIVVIILAVTVILTITKNNPIESAKEAVFKEDVRAFQDELNMYISNEYTRLQGQRDIKITAKKYEKNGGKDSVYTYIPDFKKKYEGKLAIKEDMIAYVGTDEKEKEWLLNSGVYMAKTLTVKYVDQDGNKLKEDASMPLMDNYYSVDVPEIEGYIRFSEKLEGKISQDIEVIAEYYLENDNLAFMGLDASGKETTDEASIVSYEVTGIGECNVSKIAIPREHNGKPVTNIKQAAFRWKNGITGVIIGNNIIKIKENAFYGCENLEKVSIGKNVEIMGYSIFTNCNKLTDLIILSEKVTVNNNIIGNPALLEEIKVNSDNNKYKFEDGILFSKDGTKIYSYLRNRKGEIYNIPIDVNEIEEYAFTGCNNLKKIVVTENVNKVGSRAFEACKNLTNFEINVSKVGDLLLKGCSNLESVTIGENVESMGWGIFNDCNKLTNLEINTEKLDINNNIIGNPAMLKEIKVNSDNNKYKFEDGILFSKDGTKIYLYLVNRDGEIYNVPNNVTEINNYAFIGCNNLKKIIISQNVNKIGNKVFVSCPNLETLILGDSIESMGYGQFGNCNNLTSITYLGTKEKWTSTLGKTNSWKGSNISIKKIICSDGEISL